MNKHRKGGIAMLKEFRDLIMRKLLIFLRLSSALWTLVNSSMPLWVFWPFQSWFFYL